MEWPARRQPGLSHRYRLRLHLLTYIPTRTCHMMSISGRGDTSIHLPPMSRGSKRLSEPLTGGRRVAKSLDAEATRYTRISWRLSNIVKMLGFRYADFDWSCIFAKSNAAVLTTIFLCDIPLPDMLLSRAEDSRNERNIAHPQLGRASIIVTGVDLWVGLSHRPPSSAFTGKLRYLSLMHFKKLCKPRVRHGRQYVGVDVLL